MRFYSLGQLNNEEKNNILHKHRELYNGYKKVWENGPNEQPLYTQDFANDKGGIVVTNKGDVKTYTNYGINESIEDFDDIKDIESKDEFEDIYDIKDMTSQENFEDIYDVKDINPHEKFDYIEGNNLDEFHSAFEEEVDEEIGGPLYSEVDPAYSFISKGPMQEDDMEEGYYDTSDWDNIDLSTPQYNIGGEEEDVTSYDEDLITKIRKKSEDIEDIDFEEIDDEIKESFMNQKNKINEMFLRFQKYN